ncbi:MAG: hypothetical protein WKG00_00900 [Polyangiaceae bacterium]
MPKTPMARESASRAARSSTSARVTITRDSSKSACWPSESRAGELPAWWMARAASAPCASAKAAVRRSSSVWRAATYR